MADNKPWYLSKGVWGGLIAAAAGVLGMLGFDVAEGDIQTITDLTLDGVVTVFGLLAAWGRIIAKSRIG